MKQNTKKCCKCLNFKIFKKLKNKEHFNIQVYFNYYLYNIFFNFIIKFIGDDN